jgi:hypothetical protein
MIKNLLCHYLPEDVEDVEQVFRDDATNDPDDPFNL